jgi:hypothetical protein
MTEDSKDLYVWLRTTEGLSDEQRQSLTTLESMATIDGEKDVFTLITGDFARLYVVKEENIGSQSELAAILAPLDVDKALVGASCTPDRIVHRHTLPHMAFVKVWVTPNTVPCPVLENISLLEGFIAGAVVDSDYNICVEFGDESDSGPVQNGARAVALVPGVARTSIHYVG